MLEGHAGSAGKCHTATTAQQHAGHVITVAALCQRPSGGSTVLLGCRTMMLAPSMLLMYLLLLGSCSSLMRTDQMHMLN